jgi:cyclopropane-fatty-acyl-phospholipid synthase
MKPEFWQKLVLSEMEKMTAGRLTLILPNGEERLVTGEGADARFKATVRFTDIDAFRQIALSGAIGFAEAFIDGQWETEDLAGVIKWAVHNAESSPTLRNKGRRRGKLNVLRRKNLIGHIQRRNSIKNSRRNISEHYDLGNEFYSLWLDSTMTYSSARFVTGQESLEEAQTAKYEALCQKLRLQRGEHVLEIGCGWGGFTEHAVKHYGVRVTGITISEEQLKFANERYERVGIADQAKAIFQDYRTLEGQFDKIASIEMLEAVGEEYLETYFAACDRLLKPEGLIGLQYITVPDSRHDRLKKDVDFIQKHIFPGSLLLSVFRINEALRSTGEFFMHGCEDLGDSYARTLRMWRETFNTKLDAVKQLGFDDSFIRKWNYYLAYCEGAFAARNISVVQAVYTRPNNYSLSTTL